MFKMVSNKLENSRFHELKRIHHTTSYIELFFFSLQLMKQLGKGSTWKFHKSYVCCHFDQKKFWPILDHFIIVSNKFEWHVMTCSKELKNKNLYKTNKVNLEKTLDGKTYFFLLFLRYPIWLLLFLLPASYQPILIYFRRKNEVTGVEPGPRQIQLCVKL